MSAHCPEQSVLFPDLFAKPVVACFDVEHVTSDAGVVLLHAKDRELGLIASAASCLEDARSSDRTKHSVAELLRQRVNAIALGYEDCNDATTLRHDPMMKMCASRSLSAQDDLASQPTLSRFENSVSIKQNIALQARTMEIVLDACRRRYGKRVKKITIDLDPTDDPTYGSQQLSLFNGFYDNHCYLPLMGFVSFDDHREHHMIAALLRPGNAHATQCAKDLLEGVICELKDRFPHARILVRLDGGFASPKLLEQLDRARKVDYVVGIAKNSVLKKLAEPLMAKVRTESEGTGRSAQRFEAHGYKAGKWKKARRVILKAEVTRYESRDPRDNPRFVVTNLKVTPRAVYELYCKRGEAENKIKEMKIDLQSGRTSCTKFTANQLRLTMTMMAFVLIQEIRADAAGTQWERATVATIRNRLLKIGARVLETKRRFVMHLPRAFPWIDVFRKLSIST